MAVGKYRLLTRIGETRDEITWYNYTVDKYDYPVLLSPVGEYLGGGTVGNLFSEKINEILGSYQPMESFIRSNIYPSEPTGRIDDETTNESVIFGINPELGGNNYVYYSESEYIYLGTMSRQIESYVFTTEFSGKNNCHTIDLSTIKLNIGRETLSNLFYSCTNLSSLTLPINLDISNVRSMSGMFYGCSSITEIDMSSWTNGNNIDMRRLFYSCSELTTLKMFPYTFTSDTKYDRMFAFTDLRLLDISGWDMTNFNADSGVLNIYNANLDENNRLTIICSEQTEQIIKSIESGTEYMDFVRPS